MSLNKRIVFAGLTLLAGSGMKPLMANPSEQVFEAVYADAPVVVDGRLDDAVWQQAKAYPFGFSAADAAGGAKLTEPGSLRLAWDEKHLYAAFEFEDSDVVAEADTDQLQLQKYGDVAELFLKPSEETWYWELHVSPNGKKSAFFFPSKGRLGVPSGFEYRSGLIAGAAVDGTLNDWEDRDRRWTAEMAIPLSELTARAVRFGPDVEWRVLTGRYNYSRHLPDKELSSAPALSQTNFHDLARYGVLKIMPKRQGKSKRPPVTGESNLRERMSAE